MGLPNLGGGGVHAPKNQQQQQLESLQMPAFFVHADLQILLLMNGSYMDSVLYFLSEVF